MIRFSEPWWVLLPAWTLACVDEPGPESPTASIETGDSSAVADLSITAQEGMDGVQLILDSEPFAIQTVADTYLWLMSEGDPDCPGGGTDLTGIVPVEGCTSENGLTYLGVSSYLDLGEELELGGTISGFVLGADMEIIDADGHAFEGGGYTTIHKENLGLELPKFGVMGVAGTWRYPAASGALGEGISGEYIAHLEIEGGAWSLVIDGALSVGSNAAYFNELLYGGEACPEGLTGGLELRTPEGRWMQVDMGTDCDLCGQASRESSGEDLGEVCLSSLSSLARTVEALWP